MRCPSSNQGHMVEDRRIWQFALRELLEKWAVGGFPGNKPHVQGLPIDDRLLIPVPAVFGDSTECPMLVRPMRSVLDSISHKETMDQLGSLVIGSTDTDRVGQKESASRHDVRCRTICTFFSGCPGSCIRRSIRLGILETSVSMTHSDRPECFSSRCRALAGQ
ncbi:hypothetical protein N7510_006572 [Penicillium lagena]|uniref:uncharacterized protein n=1 Tax=Penicillium lagena TaxID=94218 RepID=UPI00253FFB01|nr:uncharacterized protein N7510_006572 [Penicillium lagena]KAJ5613378.1 hypothetical protein N7510_006572 [Penicillium lagena]